MLIIVSSAENGISVNSFKFRYVRLQTPFHLHDNNKIEILRNWGSIGSMGIISYIQLLFFFVLLTLHKFSVNYDLALN